MFLCESESSVYFLQIHLNVPVWFVLQGSQESLNICFGMFVNLGRNERQQQNAQQPPGTLYLRIHVETARLYPVHTPVGPLS
jgi:hypothetical protein